MAPAVRFKISEEIYELRGDATRGRRTRGKTTAIPQQPPPASKFKQRLELSLYEQFVWAWGEGSLPFDGQDSKTEIIRILDVSSDGKINPQLLDISKERDAQSVGAKLTEITPNLATRLIINSTQREEPTPKDILAKAMSQTFAVEPSMLCTSLWRRRESLSGFKDPFSPIKPSFVNFEDGQCAKIMTGILLTPTHSKKATIVLVLFVPYLPNLKANLEFGYPIGGSHVSMVQVYLNLCGNGALTDLRIPPYHQGRWTVNSLLDYEKFQELLYHAMLSQWDPGKLVTANGNPLLFLLPIAHLQIAHFQSLLGPIAEKVHGWRSGASNVEASRESPYQLWRCLRGSSEILEMAFNNLKQYAMVIGAECSLQVNEINEVYNAYQQVLDTACAFEQHVKEDLQLQVGQLSLIESRKSILQSEITIAESKRVKLITILAFVFIPVSVATSIFGMNVQEINSTGHFMWVVIVTVIVLLFGALVLWSLSNRAMKWYDDPRNFHSREGPAWAERKRAFSWLISHGYTSWMVKSGIWFSLMTDGRFDFEVTHDEYHLHCIENYTSSHDPHRPWEYTHKHSRELTDARGFKSNPAKNAEFEKMEKVAFNFEDENPDQQILPL